MNRVWNEEVRKRAGKEMEMACRVEPRVSRWLGHVERIDEYHMARRVLMAEVSGGQVLGRPRLGWMGDVTAGGLGQQGDDGGGCSTMHEK